MKGLYSYPGRLYRVGTGDQDVNHGGVFFILAKFISLYKKEVVMSSIYDLLLLLHLIGLSLGLGAATVKMIFVIKINLDHEFLPVYFKVAKIVTRLIVSGILILTLSGIGWIIYGYSSSPLFIVKLVLVGLMWILGPIIDNVFEPKLVKSAPLHGKAGTQDFNIIQKRHLVMEIMATLLMYAITIVGVML